jgi:hypothetical protein
MLLSNFFSQYSLMFLGARHGFELQVGVLNIPNQSRDFTVNRSAHASQALRLSSLLTPEQKLRCQPQRQCRCQKHVQVGPPKGGIPHGYMSARG